MEVSCYWIYTSKESENNSSKGSKKNNSMAMEAILEGLTYIQKKNIGKCIPAKELWIRLEQLYSKEEQ